MMSDLHFHIFMQYLWSPRNHCASPHQSLTQNVYMKPKKTKLLTYADYD